MLHVYHGDGKGKTTAAIGQAVRAAGAGRKVLFTQFMKGNVSSEIGSLRQTAGIRTLLVGKQFGFYRDMSAEDKAGLRLRHDEILREIKRSLEVGEADVVIMDELTYVYRYGLAEKNLIWEILEMTKGKMETEAVITGREPDESFLQAADYVTEMKMQKHPYEKGISARKGIEW